MMTLQRRDTEACQSPSQTQFMLPSVRPLPQDLSLGNNSQVWEEATDSLACDFEGH